MPKPQIDRHTKWLTYKAQVDRVAALYAQRQYSNVTDGRTLAALVAAVADDIPTPDVGALTHDSKQRFRTSMRVSTLPSLRIDTLIDTGNASESIMPRATYNELVKHGLPLGTLVNIPPITLSAANNTPIHVSQMLILNIKVADPLSGTYTPGQDMRFYVMDADFDHVLIASKYVKHSIGAIVKRLIDYYSGVAPIPAGVVHVEYADGAVCYVKAAQANRSTVATVEVTKKPGELLTFTDILPLVNELTEDHLNLEMLNLSLMAQGLHANTPADDIVDQMAEVTPRPAVTLPTGTGLQSSTMVAPNVRPSTTTNETKEKKIADKLYYLEKGDPSLYTKLYQFMYRNYDALFNSMGCFKNATATIELVNGARKILEAFRGSYYRAVKKEYEDAVRDNIDVLLLNGIIAEVTPEVAGSAPFVSPAHVVLKAPKPDGTMQVRITVDMRRINDVTVKHAPRHRTPTCNSKFDEITGRKILVVADLRSAFHLVPLAPEAQIYTIFSLGGKYYKYLRMPMGAVNSAIDFQDIVVEQFPGFYPYLDDIVFGVDTPNEALEKLYTMFELALKNGATFDLDKLKIGDTVKILGFSTDGIKRWFGKEDKSALTVTDPNLKLKRLDDVRAFIGVAMWYSPFLPGIQIVLKPLRDWLTTARRIGDLTPEAESAIRSTQTLIREAQPLWLPVRGKPFYIATDASNLGLSGVLMQMHPVTNKEGLTQDQLARAVYDTDGTMLMPRPVAYWSQPLSEYDKNLNVTEREALAILHSTLTWRDELQGSQVIMFSDHANLAYMFTSSNLLVRRAAVQMCSFLHPVFVHIAGKNNQLADFMSRFFLSRFPTVEQTLQVAAITGERAEPYVAEPSPTVTASGTVASISASSSSSTCNPAAHDVIVGVSDNTVYAVSMEPSSEGPDVCIDMSTGIPRKVVATVTSSVPALDPLEAALEQYFQHDLNSEPPEMIRSGSKRKSPGHPIVAPVGTRRKPGQVVHMTDKGVEILRDNVPTVNPSDGDDVDVSEIEEEPELVQLTKWRAPILQALSEYNRELKGKTPAFAALYPDARVTEIRGHKVWTTSDGRIIVPAGDTELKERILLASHEDSNHCGVHQTQRNAFSFVWPHMHKEAQRYVETCPQCQISRPVAQPQAHGKYIVKQEKWPGQHVIIDVVGPMPTCGGYNYIITIVDEFSRFKYSEPTKDCTAKAAMAVLMRWCMLYGIPDVVQSDNGSNFVSNEFKAFLQTLGIEQYLSKTYHAQSQGRQERQTQQLKHAIATYSKENKLNWVDSLFRYQSRCNQMINRSIGMAPITAFLGREAKLPSDIEAGKTLYDPAMSQEGWASFLAHLRAIQAKAYQQSLLSQQVYKQAHDSKRVSLELKPGDHVIAIEPTATGIAPGWQGPFVVVEQDETRENTYKIRHLVKDKELVLHEQRLRRFDLSRMTESDLRQLGGARDDEYLVEAIREVVIQGNGEVMVLVKWRYEDSPTWQKLADMKKSSPFIRFLATKGYQLNPSGTKVVKIPVAAVSRRKAKHR